MKRSIKLLALFTVVIFMVIFPVVISPNDVVNTIAVFTLITAIAATAWNIFSGYTGYISLGHSVFYGFGAYTIALLSREWQLPGGWMPFLLLPLAGLIAGIVAFPLGWLALRMRRHTFVVITIAFLFIFQLLAYNLRDMTGGSRGVFLPLIPWVAPYANLPFYYVTFLVLLIAVYVSWWIRNSKFGLGLLAIRDDEDRARGLGIKTELFKLGAYVTSAVFMGLAGAIFAYYVSAIYPEGAFNPAIDTTTALTGFLGGLGTLAGPLIGALLVGPLQQWLELLFGGNGLDLMVYGLLFLLILLTLPQGIVPSLRKRWSLWRASRKTRIMTAATGEQKKAAFLETGEG